ncbi:hypothetical protein [Effusibacillus consociatus]|uniref:Uncharacterized protein n=1 Tax=Effusibacillus consociatus TaxID=1117041 RepID=A0ABV9Q0K0_9BACL
MLSYSFDKQKGKWVVNLNGQKIMGYFETEVECIDYMYKFVL